MAHLAALVLLLVPLHDFETLTWAPQVIVGPNSDVWYPFDAHIFQANAIVTAGVCLAAPIFYFMRRAALRRVYSFEFSFFGQFARNRPAHEPEHSSDDSTCGTDTTNGDEAGDWTAVLGVSAYPTISEVKNAYKILLRQNHPDRVQDLAPAFKMLAEAEAKKINAAYRRALLHVVPEMEAAE